MFGALMKSLVISDISTLRALTVNVYNILYFMVRCIKYSFLYKYFFIVTFALSSFVVLNYFTEKC